MDGIAAPSEQHQAHLNLIAAVITVAISDWNELVCRMKRLGGDGRRSSVYLWLVSSERDAFTFEWCCVILGLEPEVVRSRILKGSI